MWHCIPKRIQDKFSCASNPGDFKVGDVEKGKGAFYGTFKLIVDGSSDVGSCNLIFADKNEDEQHLIRNIISSFDNKLTSVGKGKMTYIGDITATYSTKEESKAMFLLGGAIAGALAASDAEGKGKRLQFKVKNNIKEATKLFQKVVTTQGKVKVTKSIMQFPKVSRLPASE